MSDKQSKLLDGRLEGAKRLAKIAKLPAAEDDEGDERYCGSDRYCSSALAKAGPSYVKLVTGKVGSFN